MKFRLCVMTYIKIIKPKDKHKLILRLGKKIKLDLYRLKSYNRIIRIIKTLKSIFY